MSKKICKIISLTIVMIIILAMVMTVIGVPTPQPVAGGSTVSKVAGRAIKIAQYVCYTAAVILIMALGIKFITAAPEAKANVQKSAIYYVVGAIMVLAAGAILTLISLLGSSTNFQ